MRGCVRLQFTDELLHRCEGSSRVDHCPNVTVCPGAAPCAYSCFAHIRTCTLWPMPAWICRDVRIIFYFFSLRWGSIHMASGVVAGLLARHSQRLNFWNAVLKEHSLF